MGKTYRSVPGTKYKLPEGSGAYKKQKNKPLEVEKSITHKVKSKKTLLKLQDQYKNDLELQKVIRIINQHYIVQSKSIYKWGDPDVHYFVLPIKVKQDINIKPEWVFKEDSKTISLNDKYFYCEIIKDIEEYVEEDIVYYHPGPSTWLQDDKDDNYLFKQKKDKLCKIKQS